MYSYPITPEQLKIMWEALRYVVWYEDPDEEEEKTYNDLKEYFKGYF